MFLLFWQVLTFLGGDNKRKSQWGDLSIDDLCASLQLSDATKGLSYATRTFCRRQLRMQAYAMEAGTGLGFSFEGSGFRV